nr:MAG TPA: hypothetical protein [Caudoviricetes sp.]
MSKGNLTLGKNARPLPGQNRPLFDDFRVSG